MKNECAKSRPKDNPYEIWQAGDWFWYVLKKWQVDDNKPYARWYCLVRTPIVPKGEYGDTYVTDIKTYARKLTEEQKAKVLAWEGDLFPVLSASL